MNYYILPLCSAALEPIAIALLFPPSFVLSLGSIIFLPPLSTLHMQVLSEVIFGTVDEGIHMYVITSVQTPRLPGANRGHNGSDWSWCESYSGDDRGRRNAKKLEVEEW